MLPSVLLTGHFGYGPLPLPSWMMMHCLRAKFIASLYQVSSSRAAIVGCNAKTLRSFSCTSTASQMWWRVFQHGGAASQSLDPTKFIDHGQKLPMSARGIQTAVESTEGLHTLEEKPKHIKTKKLTKTAAYIMQILDKEDVAKARSERLVPDLRPGDVVQLRVEVPENKRRVSSFRGIVMAIRRSGLQSTFRIRRFLAGVGVEMVFPLFSPNIKEMKVLEHRKVRRNKLYYLRDKIKDKRNKIT